MLSNDDGSHAEDGGRSRSRMPWRKAEDSDATTSARDGEPIRATRHERTVDDHDDRHGVLGRDSDRGDSDRGDSDRVVDNHGGHDSGRVQQVVDRNAEARNHRDDRVSNGQDDRLGEERDAQRDDHRGSERAVVDHESVTEAQKERHGGVKVGSAFFGWLTATGMAVLLTALLAAAGAAIGVGNNTSITKATDAAASNSKTVGIVGAVVLLVIVLVAYYCGGYVAGRMARFNGLRQGVAVWVWTLVIAVVLAVLAAAAGQKYNVSATLNIFPRIPVGEGTLTTAGIIALLAVAVVALIGAILGGLAGMHYHRRVDHTVPIAAVANR